MPAAPRLASTLHTSIYAASVHAHTPGNHRTRAPANVLLTAVRGVHASGASSASGSAIGIAQLGPGFRSTWRSAHGMRSPHHSPAAVRSAVISTRGWTLRLQARGNRPRPSRRVDDVAALPAHWQHCTAELPGWLQTARQKPACCIALNDITGTF